MIQFNLLPDVKLEYLKAERTRQTVITASVIVTLVSLGIFASFMATNLYQKRHISDLSNTIASEKAKLEGKSQINKILTIQNQLQSLTALHDAKPAASKVFTYLNQVTPDKIVSISSLTIDFTKGTLDVTGTADSLAAVNQYIDTLKFTTYQVKGGSSTGTASKAFTNVVMTSFSYTTPGASGGATAAPASYTLDFSYDPTIFDNTKDVTLNVPANTTTTRSEVDKPTDLFVPAPQTKTTGGVQ